VLVSDVTAARYWPGEEALGKRVRFGPGDWSTIVGITRGVRHQGMAAEPRPELYFPYAQRPGRAMSIVVRSDGDEAAVTNLLRSELRDIAPTLPLSNVATMSSLMASSVAQPRFVMSLTAAFGLLALVLASVGIYGVMSYAVSRRTSEMGLRIALGAARTSVLRLIVSQGARVTAVGLAAGLAMAWWGTQEMSMLLFDVDARDAATFVTAPLVLAAVSLIACLVPAVRATRIDPAVTLKGD
jgi:putative ABC transport system permease protein